MNLNELKKVLIATFGEKYQGKALTPTNLVVGIGEKNIMIEDYKTKTTEQILEEIKKEL